MYIKWSEFHVLIVLIIQCEFILDFYELYTWQEKQFGMKIMLSLCVSFISACGLKIL